MAFYEAIGCVRFSRYFGKMHSRHPLDKERISSLDIRVLQFTLKLFILFHSVDVRIVHLYFW